MGHGHFRAVPGSNCCDFCSKTDSERTNNTLFRRVWVFRLYNCSFRPSITYTWLYILISHTCTFIPFPIPYVRANIIEVSFYISLLHPGGGCKREAFSTCGLFDLDNVLYEGLLRTTQDARSFQERIRRHRRRCFVFMHRHKCFIVLPPTRVFFSVKVIFA